MVGYNNRTTVQTLIFFSAVVEGRVVLYICIYSVWWWWLQQHLVTQ